MPVFSGTAGKNDIITYKILSIMKTIITAVALVAIISLIIAIDPTFAQQGVPIGPGDGDGHTTPIGGVAVLAALGGGYAIKKIRDRRHDA